MWVEADATYDFADSLISFMVFLTQNPAGGSMIVGAGLVPLLVQILQNREPNRLQVRALGCIRIFFFSDFWPDF